MKALVAIKIGAERRAGVLLAKLEKPVGGRGKTGSILKSVLGAKTKSGATVTAHRWQTMATVPDADVKRLEAELTQAEKEARNFVSA